MIPPATDVADSGRLSASYCTVWFALLGPVTDVTAKLLVVYEKLVVRERKAGRANRPGGFLLSLLNKSPTFLVAIDTVEHVATCDPTFTAIAG